MKLLSVLGSLLVISLLPLCTFSQTYCTAENQSLCEATLDKLKVQNYESESIEEIAVKVGKEFLGTPYVGKSLEVGDKEQLVIDLQGLDCTTFLENVIVFSRLAQRGEFSFEGFQQELAFLRYRNGKLDSYTSRLHYFTEWITDNASKGIIKDITQSIGGQLYEKHINFMSTHRTAYKQLSSDKFVEDIEGIEQKLNQQKRYYIPKHKVQALESGIKSGDLIAISTSIKGLDVSHTGMAIKVKGRIHLLHASTRSKKVEISTVPLADYLQKSKSQSGIIVCRLLNQT